MDKSSILGMPMSPQEISKRYKRQSLGMPRGTPSSSVKIRSSFKTLYLYYFVYYAFFLECSLFLVLRLAFVFRLDFWSDLVISLYQGVFIPLVYDGFHL
jgi:hypothetical protein